MAPKARVTPTSGRDRGDRSRRGCARRDRHGDHRARRAVRAVATASVARPHRPRPGALDLPPVYRAPLGETAKAQLAIMRDTERHPEALDAALNSSPTPGTRGRGRPPPRRSTECETLTDFVLHNKDSVPRPKGRHACKGRFAFATTRYLHAALKFASAS